MRLLCVTTLGSEALSLKNDNSDPHGFGDLSVFSLLKSSQDEVEGNQALWSGRLLQRWWSSHGAVLRSQEEAGANGQRTVRRRVVLLDQLCLVFLHQMALMAQAVLSCGVVELQYIIIY